MAKAISLECLLYYLRICVVYDWNDELHFKILRKNISALVVMNRKSIPSKQTPSSDKAVVPC